MIEVEVNGEILEFPDSMSQEQIRDVLRKRYAPKDDGFSASEMVQNIPGSAYQFGKNIWDAATNPKQTAQGVWDLAMGGSQWLDRQLDDTPLERFSFTPANLAEDKTGVAEAFGGAVKDRYGSVDAALNTLEQDPVGLLADAATVTAPITKGLLNPAAMPRNVARTAVSRLASKNAPARMYERAAKWRPGIADDAARSRLTETALRNRLLPNSAGTTRLGGLIKSFNSKIDDLISQAEASGKTLPRQAVYKHIDDLKKQTGGWNIDAPSDLKAIDDLVNGFEDYASKNLPANMTARDLQNFKVKLYERINWDAKRMTGTPIGESTRKTVARGAKEGVEELVPDVKGLNQQLSDLYNLQPELERVAGRLGNRNLIPLEAPIEVGAGSAAGGLIGGPAGAAVGGGIGAGASLLGHYAVSPRLALWLRNLQEQSMAGLLSQQGPVSMGLLGAGQADRASDLASGR